ncbi:putative GTPase [Clostridium saccharobutylicum]|nr:hypothetical protein [Clostridium saccharobutylicum]NOV95341.1 putative GTPase [Clostridium saccharobutylicum]
MVHPVVSVSALNKSGIEELKQTIIAAIPDNEDKFKLVGDLVSPGEHNCSCYTY